MSDELNLDIRESLTFELDENLHKLADMTLNEFDTSQKNGSFLVEIAAIHEGVTANYNRYLSNELRKSISTWTDPYPRPIIRNHDILNEEPLGRIVSGRMSKDEAGSVMIIQAAILDPMAIEKIADGRYLTGSVGGIPTEAICSICGVDWRNPPQERDTLMPCSHRRGEAYGDKKDRERMELIMKGIVWKEYSFVNAPADSDSRIIKVNKNSEAVNFMYIDKVSESIYHMTPGGPIDLFTGKPKNVRTSLYEGLANTIHLAEQCNLREDITTNNSDEKNLHQENDMAKTDENDDILDAVDKAIAANNEETSSDAEVEETEVTESEETSTEEDVAEEASADEEASEETEDSAEESEDNNEDVESDESDTEQEESPIEESTADSEEEDASTEESEEAEEEATEEEVEESEDTETVEDATEGDNETESLKEEIVRLTEQNAQLRGAIHRMLAKDVVDVKIECGLIDPSERSQAIEEHAERSPSSLADSLKDLAKMREAKPTVTNDDDEMKVESDVVVTDNLVDEEDGSAEESVPPAQRLEHLFHELMQPKNS